MDTIDPPRSWQDQDIMTFLGQEAPRYTSYPSAHHFTSLDAVTYEGWLGSLSNQNSVGIYVHVPFCEQMCYFCGCNTQITRRYDPIASYAECLIKEIRLVGARLGFRPKIHSLHFGGGSPGILTPKTMTAVFDALAKTFDLQRGAEVSIELDPRHVTAEQAQALAGLGFNRVSLGVQDTNPIVQAAINRRQPLSLIQSAVDTLRREGLDALSIDLLYGLPLQTAATLETTMSDIAQLNPQRISAFSYAHVPWMKKHQQLLDADALPTIREKALQYLQIDTQFQAMGYTAVGIDHFAKPGDGLAKAVRNGTLRRNFMGYTDLPNDRLIAFGGSSISQLDEGIAQNIPQSTPYQRLVNDGQLPIVRGWIYRDDDKMRNAVITELMCRFEVNIDSVLSRFGFPQDYLDREISKLSAFEAAGLVTIEGRRVRFDSPFKMLVRSVACVFDTYARNEGEGRYSKVA